jgi:hypothetical protein
VTSPQPAQDLEAVNIGETDVENDQIKGALAEQSIGLLAGRRVIDGVSGAVHELNETFGEKGIIFNDKYAHDESPLDERKSVRRRFWLV